MPHKMLYNGTAEEKERFPHCSVTDGGAHDRTIWQIRENINERQ